MRVIYRSHSTFPVFAEYLNSTNDVIHASMSLRRDGTSRALLRACDRERRCGTPLRRESWRPTRIGVREEPGPAAQALHGDSRALCFTSAVAVHGELGLPHWQRLWPSLATQSAKMSEPPPGSYTKRPLPRPYHQNVPPQSFVPTPGPPKHPLDGPYPYATPPASAQRPTFGGAVGGGAMGASVGGAPPPQSSQPWMKYDVDRLPVRRTR